MKTPYSYSTPLVGDVFFENNCGAKPPSNKYINKSGKNQQTYKEPQKRQRGRRHLTSS
jgi:hypothetical protein